MGFMIGIDGGGTKSIGSIVDSKGMIIATAEEGSMNLHTREVEAVGHTLENLINKLINAAGCDEREVDLVSIGVAGIGRKRDEITFRKIIERINLSIPVLLNTDIKIALVGAHGKEEGIFLLSGTGSIAYGIDSTGSEHRIGGWGHILGDEGSGYDIGRRGLEKIVQGIDKRVDSSNLKKRVFDNLGFTSIDDLINFVYSAKGTKADIARIAPIVEEGAQAGDKICIDLLIEAGNKLVDITEEIIFQMPHNENLVICAGGGVLENITTVYKHFHFGIRKKYPAITIIPPKYSPVLGALIMGCKHLNKMEEINLWKNQWKQVK
ncbi:BadF/BadG/BcrA/BcrD ATPase family protein [Alkaliphilus peptidifermentans]|uniref:BadF-type ATPase n=1 Tax=Alkaliphilus peptidifermentans DSM 18978 TaxID=1120976 RepID=A0A1G5KMQ4_9FIRM|nr:BadF/BadG/BcrA/BcrD ATPase family protein [Alkaliphilus peptidifermentans]SCZ01897.1 BadF-type ATPase [Alkaliphilus peptidifermentans DSM 18978]